MTTEATALLREDAPATNTETKFDTPNAEGFFSDVPAVPVTLSGGNICHLMVAHTPRGFISGHKFFMRQPRNHVQRPPHVDGHAHATREAALSEGCELATLFFIDHATAVAQIVAWAEKHLPATELARLRSAPVAEQLKKNAFAGSDAGARATDADAAPQSAGSAPSPEPADHAPIGERINAAVRGERVPGGAAVDDDTAVTIAENTTADSPSEDAAQPARPRYAELLVSDVGPGDNPRKTRDPVKQAELVENLRTTPLLHPVVVRDLGEGAKPRYELIAGEGRWLAYQALARERIEARVFTGVDKATALAWALVENLQRSDLNAMEEAEGFDELRQLGWNTARMAEQTGKDKSTIRRALALVKLPEEVREMLRNSQLTPRHARELARWVVGPGFEDDAEHASFVARPEVCVAIAEIVVEHHISGRELEGQPVPHLALDRLRREKLIAEIPLTHLSRYDAACGENAEGRFVVGSMNYTFDVDHWKAAKKVFDREDREAEAARAEKAKRRVETAQSAQVSVPVATLKQSKLEHVVLSGELERYIDHLPEDCIRSGVDEETKAEIFYCTQPAKLKALRDAEAAAIAKQDEAVLTAHLNLAFDRVKKLKKIGARELALICAAGTVNFPPEVFKAVGLRAPKDWREVGNEDTHEQLAKFTPLDQVRVMLAGLLPSDVASLRTDADAQTLLSWILEKPKLGLVADDKREAERLLGRVAKELFAPKIPAFEGRASGTAVEFATRDDAKAWIEEQRDRAGFADYTTKIEAGHANTFQVRYARKAAPEKP